MCLVVLSLAGCGGDMPAWDDGPSWFHPKKNVAQPGATPQTAKPIPGEMPPPTPSPVPDVQRQQVSPLPGSPTSSAQPMNSARVAILLPLSGPNAGLGHSMLNAAQQAVFDASASGFELMPRDSGGDETTAAAAARDALANGAKLIIGPLFAPQVPAVYKVAQPAGVSVLTLSTDTSLTANGLYVMGFAPGAQAERIVRYAISKGVKRFAALVPANTYGALVAQAFQLEVGRDGGTMVAMDTYDPSKHDDSAEVRDIADKSTVIDALFLPEGGSDLTAITQHLAEAGVDPQKIHILGTGLWDTYDTGRVAPFAVNGWYAAPDPATRQNFIVNYKSAYAEEPPRLTTLAYDATALAAALAKRGMGYNQPFAHQPERFRRA